MSCPVHKGEMLPPTEVLLAEAVTASSPPSFLQAAQGALSCVETRLQTL